MFFSVLLAEIKGFVEEKKRIVAISNNGITCINTYHKLQEIVCHRAATTKDEQKNIYNNTLSFCLQQ